MEPAEHIAALERNGALLAAAAGRAGLDAMVPPCPPWRVRDLLRHLGYVHRWAADYVSQAREEMVDEPAEDELLLAGPGDAELLGWFRDGHAELVRALRLAGPRPRNSIFCSGTGRRPAARTLTGLPSAGISGSCGSGRTS